ncbi:hypothetical protein IRL76_10785 [Qipengyuania soli]|uniref:TonB family protein n=1 Tax=Qipengyuania soli TaxID=2782568 RepID=A0A7S8IVR7_9SPHN|nr:hypothetical protein IRL76_10785 [Qipengyuania soli]
MRLADWCRERYAGLDPEWRRKAVGLSLAVGIEALLVLLLLSLGIVNREPVPMSDSLVTVTMSENPAEEDEPSEARSYPAEDSPASQAPQPPQEEEPVQQPTDARQTPVPALIAVSPDSMRSLDISRAQPSRPIVGAQPYGPVDTARPGDSQRIAGSGPNGEPLYAARWYREPTDQELQGYLSTASGPGYALINCQTAPQYRVENCVLVSEGPQGSNMGRAVLAAAWQFKVRPPQIGGRPQVGEWVRIRITYDVRPAVPPYSR